MSRTRAARWMPIGLLAVLLQLLAPAWAFADMARALADPLRDATFCLDHDGSQPNVPSPAQHHHMACTLCHVPGPPPAMLPVGAAVLQAPVEQAPARHPRDLATAPRGPPAPAQRARAPPVLT